MFMTLKLYNQLLCNAIYWLLPSATTLLTCTVIFNLYITTVGTALPLYIYTLFPIVATVAMFMNTNVANDAAMVGLLSQSVIIVIKSYDNAVSIQSGKMFVSLYKRQALILKRIYIQNGPFGRIRPNLPAKVMEQSMSQLLLLLSF